MSRFLFYTHTVDLSPIHHSVAHPVYFVRGCYITAVDIPLRLIRLSRCGCSYGRRGPAPVVATSPFHTGLCLRFIPRRRPPTHLLRTPYGAMRSPCGGEYGRRPIHPLFMNGVNCSVPTRSGFTQKMRADALRS